MSRPRPPLRPGFTLVEILTATAIMAVVVTFVVTIISQVMNVWTASSSAVTLGANARNVLQLLNQDLQNAVFRRSYYSLSSTSPPPQWFVTYGETPFAIGSGAANPVVSTSRLMFFSPTPLRQTLGPGNASLSGDLCAIEYRVCYEAMFPTTNPAAQQYYVLHRAVINPETTGLGFATGSPDAGTTSATTYIMGSDDLVATWDAIDSESGVSANGTTLPTGGGTTVFGGENPATALLPNVVQFTVAATYYDPSMMSGLSQNDYTAAIYGGLGSAESPSGTSSINGKIKAIPNTYQPSVLDDSRYSSHVGGSVSDSIPSSSAGTPPGTSAGLTLAYVDITLTILTDDGVAQLTSPSSSGGIYLPNKETWAQFLQQYGQTYSTRISFTNPPQ
jgi:prepilin-type N-terminal cleavage/methylation domain-containing protein